MVLFKKYSFLCVTLAFFACAVSHCMEDSTGAKEIKSENMFFNLHQPTGPYGIGKITHYFTDTTCEANEDQSFIGRELLVHFWYPSENDEDVEFMPYDPWLLNDFKTGLSEAVKSKKNGEELVEKLTKLQIQTSAVWDAPISSQEKTYPVIIFGHGYGANPTEYTAICEQLASHGYIVICVQHTNVATMTELSNGTKIECTEPRSAKGFAMCAGDIRFILDQLENINNGEPETQLAGKLDLTRMGMMGHSLGGIMTTTIAPLDKRIKACVCLDSPLITQDFEKPLTKPILFFVAETFTEWCSDEELLKLFGLKKEQLATIHSDYCKQSEADAYVLELKDSDHMTFADQSLLRGILMKLWNVNEFDLGVGIIDGVKATNIVGAYVVDFFDHYMQGKRLQLLGLDSMYKEVSVKCFAK